MIVKFKQLKFQNILSFGANTTTIDFSSGLNLISGKNGCGKSTIIDSISFCLYGKPYRSIKIKELINRKNRKKLKVTCSFEVDNRDEYVVTRMLNPDKIEIWKNDEELELLSSKKLNQEELDKIIGLDYTMFKQVISLAVNYNRPFLSLGLWEKREIIEQIFNIVIFGQMLKILKKKNVDIKTKAEINDRSVDLLEQHLKTLRKQVIDLTEAQNNFQKNKENDLKTIDDRIKGYLKDKINISNELVNIKKQIKETPFDLKRLSNIKKMLEKYNKSQNELEYVIKSSHKTKEIILEHPVCPTCHTKLTPQRKDEEYANLFCEIEKAEKKISKLKLKKENIIKEIQDQEQYQQTLNDLNFKLKSHKDKMSMISKELDATENRRNEILNREINFNLDNIKNDFENKKEEYKIIWKDNKQIKKTIKNNEVVQEILSESGIKAYFFKKLIPILNAKINEYLKIFELPVALQFDELMNEKITNLNSLNNDISYYSYSEGEKKRIDMSILLSFISITKTISNWNCNLLIIDELLDSAIDENGLEKLLSSLRYMAYDNKDLCIYIISHRLQQDYGAHFNSCLYVNKKTTGFSEIEYNTEVTDG